jgi:phenylacetate-CoA ligase
MAVLAYDEECGNCYHPFVTYGLAEVKDGRLLGTSYLNFDMPLIRYDTGDGVELLRATSGGLCKAFAIREGREGDFIEDKDGRKIPLTALIFGRHHRAFDEADYIQIGQKERGKAVLYVCGARSTLKSPEVLFDLSNVKVDFTVQYLDAPIRTSAGKLKLRV